MNRSRKNGLIAFGALLIVLFAWVAVAQGLGGSSVPSGDVAFVEDVPDGAGNITREEFDAAFTQAWKRNGLEKPPEEGDEQYETVKEGAMTDLLDQAWLRGEAAEQGVTASDREVENELASIKESQFPSPAEYRKFLEDSGFTEAEVRDRVELQVLSGKIEEQIRTGAAEVTDEEIEDFYDQNEEQFRVPASRQVRLIVTASQKDSQAVEKALATDDSDKAFARLARQYSKDPSKAQGGQTTVTEGSIPDPAGSRIMESSTGTVEGPIDVDGEDYFFRVTEATPEEVRPLSEVRNQIEQQLAPLNEQEAVTSFLQDYTAKWTSRTICAEGFIVARCDNFKGTGRNPAADPACYEKPTDRRQEETEDLICPPAVALNAPIAPGSNADADQAAASPLPGQPPSQPTSPPQGPIPSSAAAPPAPPPDSSQLPVG